MEDEERKEAAAGSMIVVKKRSKAKGKTSGRQTKLTTGGDKNSLKLTEPSAFADPIEPNLPKFNDQPKQPKKPGAPRGKKAAEKEAKKEEEEEKEGEAVSEKAKSDKIATAKSIKESFLDSEEEEEDLEEMDLAARLASRPSRSKAAPTSYAGMEGSGEEEEDKAEVIPDAAAGSKSAAAQGEKGEGERRAGGGGSDEDYTLDIKDSDSGDDFISPPKRPKVSLPVSCDTFSGPCCC